MVGILTFFVIALGLVALIQLIRVYEAWLPMSSVSSWKVSETENNINAALMPIAFVLLNWMYYYCVTTFGHLLLPPSASVHGEEIDWLMNINLIVVTIVFVVVEGLLFLFAWKYVYSKNREAKYYTHNNKLELLWTVIPASFLAVIVFLGLRAWNTITADQPTENELVIELYSRQFDWTARYAGKDGQLGRSNVRFVKGANILGIDETDTYGDDDQVVRNEIHLPVNRPVKFVFRSQDVIHSAYMPHFRLQMNTVPGMTTQFRMTPKTTTQEMKEYTENPEFDYILLCNKICGVTHYNMKMDIIVESEEAYKSWIEKQKVFKTAENSETNLSLIQ